MEMPQAYPKFRWFVLLVMIVAAAASTALMIAPAPLIGEVSKTLGMDPGTATGTFMGLWNIVGATSCLVAGFLVDRLGISKMVIAGCIILIVPSLLFPLVGYNMKALILLRIIQALAVGPLTAIVAPLAATWFPPQQRGMVAGLSGFSISLGVLVGIIISPMIFAATHSWLTVMSRVAIAPMIALVLAIVMAFGPKPPAFHDEISAEAQAFADGAFKAALKSRTTWIIVATVFLSCWFFTGFNDLTPGYIAIEAPTGLGYGPMMAGKLMGIYQLFFMLGSIASGFIFEKVFRESAKATISVAFLVSGALAFTIMLAAVAHHIPVLAVVLPIIGFFAAWVMAAALAYVSINYHHSVVGRITGLAFGIGFYAGIPGIILGSLALKSTGSYHTSITIVSTVAILGAILIQFIKPLPEKAMNPAKLAIAED
ncbi:MFS transporter [Holophaga foetida]|uniref:MFS transporter n=1 Tax=Holophaga foetida TaxID=35839 RepID=UPI0002474310|nr:MFS transporter [Holophaga foetida]